MKRTIVRYVLLICVICLSLTATADSNTADMIDSYIGGIIAYNENANNCDSLQSWVDNTLSSAAGNGAEWYILSLVQGGYSFDPASYLAALENYVTGSEIKNATACERISLAFLSCNTSNSFVQTAADSAIGRQGVMSWIYGLHILNNGIESKHTKDTVIEHLLSLRTPDGGWAVSGNYSDVDVTAMAVQALAPSYDTDKDVHAAIDAALNLLSSKQHENGSYASYGNENPESCAQVITALTSLGINPLTDERFMKNGYSAVDAMLRYRLDDGSFCHIAGGNSNPTATVQAFYSLISVKRLSEGKGAFYIFDGNISAKGKSAIDLRLIIVTVIVLVALAFIAYLILKKKRSKSNFLFIIIIAVALCVLTYTVDIRSASGYYSAPETPRIIDGTVTISIRCDTVRDKSDADYIPSDGTILPVTNFDISDGDTVYDVLIKAARQFSIQVESSGNALSSHGLAYINGINYLYEYDFGDLSGWMYEVNGIFPSVGCGEYKLKDGDAIIWRYTCELGRDLE